MIDFLGLAKVVGDVVDEVYTSDEERLEASNELAKANNLHKLESKKLDIELQKSEDIAVTTRWQSDSVAGVISRTARPLTLHAMSFLLFVMVFGAMLNFVVPESYVLLVQTLVMTVYVAYFGSRGAEKVHSIKKGSDNGSAV